ncbi:MAG TPA: DUF2062 domain-containing protein [Campylobacterales bacterium]|nr:DUF2062 domain-containing protein [Campylobacterales bacterium]
MIRKMFKKPQDGSKLDQFIKKYKLPKEYLSINRKSVSRAIFWGIFIAFIPMPFQMLAILALTPFIKFNVPIAISMVWLSNPFTMPFMYYIEYQTGSFLLGNPPLPDVKLSLEWFQSHWDRILLPLYVGTISYSIIIATLAYISVNWCWINSVRKQQNKKCKP